MFGDVETVTGLQPFGEHPSMAERLVECTKAEQAAADAASEVVEFGDDVVAPPVEAEQVVLPVFVLTLVDAEDPVRGGELGVNVLLPEPAGSTDRRPDRHTHRWAVRPIVARREAQTVGHRVLPESGD